MMNYRTPLLVGAALAASLASSAALAGDGVAKSLVVSAAAFDRFNADAGNIGADFTSGKEVASAVQLGAAYDAKQFEKGMIAYAAFAAMRDDNFARGVRRAAAAYGSEAEFARALIANPRLATQIEGAGGAQARLRAALSYEVNGTRIAGKAVKQAAYDIQKASWSKAPIPDKAARLARVKTLSRPQGANEPQAQLMYARLSDQPANGGRGPETLVGNKALTLAALAVLGRAGDGSEGEIAPLLSDENTGFCINMAKLNYFQCLSVAGPYYEDVYCLGKHAIGDTAQCVVEAVSLGGIDNDLPRRLDRAKPIVAQAAPPKAAPLKAAATASKVRR
jgi:hypothetical protein